MLVGIQITQRATGPAHRIYITDKFQDDVDAARSRAALWQPLLNQSEQERVLN